MKNFNKSPNNELSSYYITWGIGKLSPHPDFGVIENYSSEEFQADIVKFEDALKLYPHSVFGYGFNRDTVYPYWRLEYKYDVETKSPVLSLCRRSWEYDDSPARDIPIICRLAMMNKVTGIMKYHVATFMHSPESQYKWKISSDDARDLDLPNGNYIVYCWLDLPTKAIGTDKSSSTCDSQGTSGRDLLSSGVARLFDEVVGRKTDESKGTSDIVLITDQGRRKERRFKCHRAILSIRSPVFDTMVTNKGFKEGNEREVEIEVVDGDVLEIVLKYIYTGECPPNIPFASIPDIVDLAEKYMMPELKDECVRQLFTYDNKDDDWIDHLNMAEKYNIDYLKTISMLALSSNIRVMEEEEIREKLSEEAMTELADVAKRWERSKTIDVTHRSWRDD